MKFRCERDVLADAVGSAGRATSGRGGALPVLAGLRLRLEGDHLEVTGSDLDLTVTAEIEVAGGDDGVAVIPARLLADIVRALEPGAVNVTVEADEATITGGRSEFSVNVIPPRSTLRSPSRPLIRSPCRRQRSPTGCVRWCRPRPTTTTA